MVEKLFRKFEQIHIDDVSRVQNRPRSIRPLCKHGPIYIYICIYISPGDEFSTQRRLSKRSMVNTMLSRIIAREREFSKGGGVQISQHPS